MDRITLRARTYRLLLQKAVIVCGLMAAQPLWSQEPSTASADHGESLADYADLPAFGGPSSVGSQLEADHAPELSPYRFEPLSRALDPYYAFKTRVNERYGLAFGGDYNALYQGASKSEGDDHGAAGVFRLYGTWTLTGRGTADSGSLTVKVENRHGYGPGITPKELAGQLGYAGLTAITYSDAGGILSNFFWHQSLLDNRVGFVAGIVDVTDYLDVYGFINPWTDFSNLAFSTNPTIPAPDPGLGGAARFTVAESFYLVAGLADANGDPGDPLDSFDSFFSANEYFTHVELGWYGSWESRDTDNAHITLWHVDDRDEASVDGGWGAAFSFSRKVGERWLPFLRGGYSDSGGTLVDKSLSAGIGYFRQARKDVIGAAINWAQPVEDASGYEPDDQYAAELFWRLQLFPHLTITPAVQYLVNAGVVPDENYNTWIFALRARLSL